MNLSKTLMLLFLFLVLSRLAETLLLWKLHCSPTRIPLSSHKIKTRIRRIHFSVPAWLACNLSTMRKEGLSSISSFPFGHLGYFLQHTFAGQELRCQVRETIEWFIVGSWCRWWLGVSAPRFTPGYKTHVDSVHTCIVNMYPACTEYTAVILILFYTLVEKKKKIHCWTFWGTPFSRGYRLK